MQRPDATERAAAIAVHDVSPATWRECRELLAMLDDAGASPVSLLVVPQYHYDPPLTRDRAFVRAMDDRLARGDELVLHGCHHVDAAPPPRTPRAWFARRVLTRSEGEFAAVDERAAAWRIDRGIRVFAELGWPLHGFVPPAWLMSDGARAALARCGHPFSYVTIRSGMFHLPGWRFERTANLCYSPDTALRRAGSRVAIAVECARARSAPLLRLSLHPQDVRVRQVSSHWQRLVAAVIGTRALVTKDGWARRVRAAEAGSSSPVTEARYAREAARAPAERVPAADGAT